MKWTINPDKTAEKELIISMVAYLRDNPTVNDDLNVLRFICRDWYTLERTLHTRATIDTIRRRLNTLGIRYIHRTPDQQWYYWNDYTPLAMMDFYPVTTDRLETPKPSPRGKVRTEAPTPPRQSRASLPSTPDGVFNTEQTELTGQERISLETMPLAPPRHSTSQSGAANIQLANRSTDASSYKDDTTEDEVEYIGTRKPDPEADDSTDTSDSVDKQITPVKTKIHPETPSSSDDDGFTPVVTRQNRRNKKSPAPVSNIHHTTDQEKQFPSSQTRHQTENSGILPMQDISPPVEIRLTELPDAHSRMEDHLNLPVQVDTVTEMLQERLFEMTNTIDRREQQLLARLRTSEERLYKKERKMMTERQQHQQYIEKTMKRLEDWEENLLKREQSFDRNKSNMQTQYERYTRKYDELQLQAERATTAWQEIAQTALKEKLDIQIREQTEKIEEFATDQEQKLISLLDGYEEHARESKQNFLHVSMPILNKHTRKSK